MDHCPHHTDAGPFAEPSDHLGPPAALAEGVLDHEVEWRILLRREVGRPRTTAGRAIQTWAQVTRRSAAKTRRPGDQIEMPPTLGRVRRVERTKELNPHSRSRAGRVRMQQFEVSQLQRTCRGVATSAIGCR